MKNTMVEKWVSKKILLVFKIKSRAKIRPSTTYLKP